MPAGRIEKSRMPKDVPDLGVPDRRRVLNVMAQRRYRQRRKEKIAALEAQVKGLDIVNDHCSTSTNNALPETNSALQDSETIEGLISMPGEDHLQTCAPFDMDSVPDPSSKTWAPPSSSLDGLHLSDFPSHPVPLLPTPDVVELQQEPPLNGFNFPLTADGGVLDVPILSAVRAFISIATALNVTDHLWDPCHLHVMPAFMSNLASLPANLRPVTAQLVIPHHPSLDLLPWPSMREKLICMLAMPSKLRPPIAREDDQEETDINGTWLFANTSCSSSIAAPVSQSKAIVQLVQDLEDLQDGIRVHGNLVAWGQGNEFVEEAWEVGELFYRKWWWCLDQKIIEQSNERRRERGLGRLRIAA